MEYYTSDLHLGDTNMILTTRTQFHTTEEMDEFLINKWNKKVKDEDVVFILGDLSYRSQYHISYYLERMKGRKILVVGNHDECWMKNVVDLAEYFEKVEPFIVTHLRNQWLTLSHYPLLEWCYSRYCESDQFKGYDNESTSLLIHGHIHNNCSMPSYTYIKENLPAALNAGIDVNNYEPVTIEELIENNKKWYGRE